MIRHCLFTFDTRLLEVGLWTSALLGPDPSLVLRKLKTTLASIEKKKMLFCFCTRALVENFPGEGATKKRPKISKKYRKNSTICDFQGENGKKKRKR